MVILGDKIKTADQIQSSITRIAYQIYENNINENELVIVGIAPRGSELAKALKNALESFSNLKIIYGVLDINKENPRDSLAVSYTHLTLPTKRIV